MSRCKFTIITVCYNAENTITDTIRSVLSQTCDEFQYIIKDGSSSDGTMGMVHNLTDNDNRVMIMQGKDNGIYDAMNIAVRQAQGGYILFLNAGDILADQNVLHKVSAFTEKEEADICFGDIIEAEGSKKSLRVYTQKNCKIWYYSLGACLCHQGMFCKRELFQRKLFDITYKVCADREWQLYHIRRGASARAMGFPIAEVLVDGFSKSHEKELEEETRRCVRNYCGSYYMIYAAVSLLKKNRLLHHLIQKTEKAISCK